MNIKNDSKINILNKLEMVQKIHKDGIERNVSDPTRSTKECMGRGQNVMSKKYNQTICHPFATKISDNKTKVMKTK